MEWAQPSDCKVWLKCNFSLLIQYNIKHTGDHNW